jgi:ubiquinone/menaquinone biosynthesis C-methylase UbiE
LTPKSLWSDTSQIDSTKAREMAEYFEKRSRYKDQKEINDALKDLLNPKNGDKILDVGCGTGILTRLIAPSLFPKGSITGIDISNQFIELARNHIQDLKYKSIIKFDVGSAEKLPYPDEYFDAVFATRLLIHVDNPQQTIKELKRVVKKKGRIILADWDFDTLVVDHSNRLITRKIIHWRTDNKDGNNWSGRQLFRLLKEQDLEEIAIKPVITIATDEDTSLTQSIFNGASGALEAHIITEIQHEAWIIELKKRLQEGAFFASIVYFLVKAIKS